MDKFWMVFKPNGYPPEKQHVTKESAEREQERLARLYPGSTFYLLEAMSAAHKAPDVIVTKLEHVHIPF